MGPCCSGTRAGGLTDLLPDLCPWRNEIFHDVGQSVGVREVGPKNSSTRLRCGAGELILWFLKLHCIKNLTYKPGSKIQ